MKFVTVCNRIIAASFYILLFLVPIVFTGDTSELFEFNKMWVTYGLVSIIAAAWLSKIIFLKQIVIRRTPLDIPILLFLLSQIISTIKSLDPYVSWWGYYSRFNGGLLSIICYVLLYFTLVSNFDKKQVIRLLQVSLLSGLFVSLWGLPAHFGYDPTCFVFRGSFDVSCWTAAFQPKVRIFSTMGQPDWLAAYLLILIPLAMAFGIDHAKKKKYFTAGYYFFLMILFYIDMLFTKSKGNFAAFVIPFILFLPAYFLITRERVNKAFFLGASLIACIVATFIIGTPFTQLDRYSYANLQQKFTQSAQKQSPVQKQNKNSPTSGNRANAITGEFGGTDSGKIRLFVWRGAIDAWKHNLLFGTGVETFAFAYYLYRPAGHNLTSEWDYLYNKAHNEYLNYLATTGLFGIITYAALSLLFFYHGILYLRKHQEQIVMQSKTKPVSSYESNATVLLSLMTGYATILISNFFGFSVVIVNIYFFIIPGMFFILSEISNPQKIAFFPKYKPGTVVSEANVGQWIGISILWLLCIYSLGVLYNYWTADKAYGLGSNLDRVGQYQNAYIPLHQAVTARPEEPVFKDELAINDAALAIGFATQKDSTNAAKLADDAIQNSNDITANHPNNVTFWKTRTRIMFTLSEINPQYLSSALDAIQKAHALAPTDAKVFYNLGLLYSQNNQLDNAIAALKQTIKLKPDYRDAYYALGVILHQEAVNSKNIIVDPAKEKQAVSNLKFILEVLSPDDSVVSNLLKSWGEVK